MTAASEGWAVEAVGHGTYRVSDEGHAHLVYTVAGPSGTWAFWNGRIYFVPHAHQGSRARRGGAHAIQSLSAPMPATVIKVLVAPGAPVSRGDTILVLEAMKMELPLRAAGDGTVKAVYCREGDLVQPDAVLVEFES
jgi:biotin carboxyl carrier protein